MRWAAAPVLQIHHAAFKCLSGGNARRARLRIGKKGNPMGNRLHRSVAHGRTSRAARYNCSISGAVRSSPQIGFLTVAASTTEDSYLPRTLFSLRRSGALCLVTFALFEVSEWPWGFGFAGGVGTSSRVLDAGFFAIKNRSLLAVACAGGGLRSLSPRIMVSA